MSAMGGKLPLEFVIYRIPQSDCELDSAADESARPSEDSSRLWPPEPLYELACPALRPDSRTDWQCPQWVETGHPANVANGWKADFGDNGGFPPY